jgi:ferredoxin
MGSTALPSNPETAVLAHHPKSTGIDQKSLDSCGAWSCNTCHSAVDGRFDTGFSRDELRLMHTEEAFRTISELH